jgi:hypothetical protein
MRRLGLAIVVFASCEKAPSPEASPSRPAAAAARPAEPVPELVAFIRKGDVWVMPPEDPGAARRVTHLGSGQAGEPAWSPDRSWIAFTASIRSETELYLRNIFLVRPDGSDLSQVTPMPRAGKSLEDGPKAPVQGRALLLVDGIRRPAAGLRLTVYGTERTWQTGPDGAFQAFVPAGGGWIKLSGMANDRRVTLFRFVSVTQGHPLDLGDLNVPYGGDETLAGPAWLPDGRRLVYLLRHSLVNRLDLEGTVSLKEIGTDGSGDRTLFTPSAAAIIAGPVVRPDGLWIKTSDGRISSVVAETRRIGESLDAGVGVPDALAAGPGGDWATLSLDSSGRLTLVHLAGARRDILRVFEPGEPVPHALSFSPDGKKLVLDRWTERDSDLWILDLASRDLRRLTTDGASAQPVWHGR